MKCACHKRILIIEQIAEEIYENELKLRINS